MAKAHVVPANARARCVKGAVIVHTAFLTPAPTRTPLSTAPPSPKGGPPARARALRHASLFRIRLKPNNIPDRSGELTEMPALGRVKDAFNHSVPSL